MAQPVDPSEIGDLPADWRVVAFQDVVDVKKGQVDPRVEPYASMVHVGPENIETGTGRMSANDAARTLGLISGKYLFDDGDVLYSKIRPYLRKAALPDFAGVCSADMYPLRPRDDQLAREFLFQYLLTEAFTRQAVSHQSRTGIPKINRLQLGQVLIVLPPLPEQRAIAHALRTVQQAREATEQVIAAVRSIMWSLAEHLYTYGPVSISDASQVVTKDTEVGSIPAQWETVPLGELADTVTDFVANGSFQSLKENVQYLKGDGFAILLRLTDHSNRYQGDFVYIDEEAYRFLAKTQLKLGDLIISNVGSIGTVFRVPPLPKPASLGPNAILIRTPSSDDFLFNWLRSRRGTKKVRSLATTTAQPKFNKTALKAMLVPVPPLQEQHQIVSALEVVSAKLAAEEQRSEALEILFRSLLNDLMSGRLPVSSEFASERPRESA